VIVVALTPDGFRRSSVAGGLPPRRSRRRTSTARRHDQPGRRAEVGERHGRVTGATGSIAASVAPVPAPWRTPGTRHRRGAERLVADHDHQLGVVLTSYPGASQLASALAAADLSANGATFDGLLTFATKSGSGAYVAGAGERHAGTGTPLTSDGAGNITEIVTGVHVLLGQLPPLARTSG
jgi:hypothetical protein